TADGARRQAEQVGDGGGVLAGVGEVEDSPAEVRRGGRRHRKTPCEARPTVVARSGSAATRPLARNTDYPPRPARPTVAARFGGQLLWRVTSFAALTLSLARRRASKGNSQSGE